MNAALLRTGKRLFESGRNAMGIYCVHEHSRAWCCAQFTPGSSQGSKGPQKTKAHLRSANHFREWCLEHRQEAVEKFPETKFIFAEIELTTVEKRPPTVTSTTSVDATGSMKIGRALLGKIIP
jgi:hypothetical protein